MLVHVHIFEPTKSLFKSNRNKKAECHTIDCTHSDQCGLFARGECSYLRALGWQRCPYGKFRTQTGYTPRARAYGTWIYDRKKEYENVGRLSGHTDMMAIVGDYVFLPYAHMTMNENVPFIAKGGAFLHGNCFLPKEHFTIDNIIKICNFRPQALFGGEIKTYQQEEVPKFLIHLSECMPDLFDVLCGQYERAKTAFEERNYVGRKALLSTIKPNIGELKDIHGGLWTWDGTYLTSKNSHASFLLIERKEYTELRIKPTEEAIVKITDNDQVTKETKLLS